MRDAALRETRALGYRTIGGSKRCVFISFGVERDRPFRDFFYREGRKNDAMWHVSFASELYDEMDPMRISTTTGRINQCEAMVVLRSSSTYRSPGVLKEVATRSHPAEKRHPDRSLWRGQPTHHPQRR